MKILENVQTDTKEKIDVMLILSYPECEIIYNAMEEYTKNNKRKRNAKKLHTQMYKHLAF